MGLVYSRFSRKRFVDNSPDSVLLQIHQPNQKTTMTYTFFSFPPEVRVQVCKVILISPHREKLVTPDPSRTRKVNMLKDMSLRLTDSPALLRTCQQIHEEATSVLYGLNVFHFDDEQHGLKTLDVPGFDRTLRWCDFITIYAFLSLIGHHNTPEISHLKLQFESADFIVSGRGKRRRIIQTSGL